MDNEKEAIFNIIIPTTAIFDHFKSLIEHMGKMNINHSLFLNYIINKSLDMNDSEKVIEDVAQRSRIDMSVDALVNEDLVEYSRVLLTTLFGVWNNPPYDKNVHYVDFVELAFNSSKDLMLLVHCNLYPTPP